MKNTDEFYLHNNEFRITISNTFPNLVQFKQEGKHKAFNNLLLSIIPEVKKYINHRLNTAIHKGHFSKSKYNANDFIDQLFIEIYDHIEEVDNENNFYIWLFKKTNELIDETIVDEEFDDLFFENIEKYTKPEWDQMIEKFSVEADGDLIMKEDLDDVSYHNANYIVNTKFVDDNEKDFIKKLDEKLSKKEIEKHIQLLLYELPTTMQTVFELFTNQLFTFEEISEIIKKDVSDVQKILKQTRGIIHKSLSNRYSNIKF